MKVKEKLKKYLNNLSNRLLDKKEHKKIIRSYTYMALFVISITMSIINVVTKELALGISTVIFAGCCLINFIIQRLAKEENITPILFGIEFIALITYFIIVGNPGGFSILWITLIPPIGMMFYGLVGGSFYSFVCLLLLIFFLWIPLGRNIVSTEAIYSHTDPNSYGHIFTLRFPFLYLAIFVLSLILEAIKSVAYKEIDKMNKRNEYLSKHDPLTGLCNRAGLEASLEEHKKNHDYKNVYLMISDIDHFKPINDNYGHLVGDEVLKQYAELFKSSLNGFTCRWGGDEFCFVGYDDDTILKQLQNFKDKMEQHVFKIDGVEINTTVSIGVVIATKEEFENLDECLNQADSNLYQAKNNGKNLLIVSKKD